MLEVILEAILTYPIYYYFEIWKNVLLLYKNKRGWFLINI